MSLRKFVLRCPLCGAVIDFGMVDEVIEMMSHGYEQVFCDECNYHFLIPIDEKLLKRGTVLC